MGGMTNDEGRVGIDSGAGGSVLAPIRRGRWEKERVLPSAQSALLEVYLPWGAELVPLWGIARAGIADAGPLKVKVVTWGRADDGADAGAVTGAPVWSKKPADWDWSEFLNKEEIEATGDELDMSGSRSILTGRPRGRPARLSGFETVRRWFLERAQRARREMRGCDWRRVEVLSWGPSTVNVSESCEADWLWAGKVGRTGES
jgi:hypothetical protein